MDVEKAELQDYLEVLERHGEGSFPHGFMTTYISRKLEISVFSVTDCMILLQKEKEAK